LGTPVIGMLMRPSGVVTGFAKSCAACSIVCG
jgi:hypothetical protein